MAALFRGSTHSLATAVRWAHCVRMDYEAELAMVRRHVAQGQRHVARQRQVLEDLRAGGHQIELAEILLRQFEDIQVLHLAHLDRLLTKGPSKGGNSTRLDTKTPCEPRGRR